MKTIKFVPVIMCAGDAYIFDLNRDYGEGLKLIYETQNFPNIGDQICFPAYDPQLVEAKAYILTQNTPMILIYTDFWSREIETECIEEEKAMIEEDDSYDRYYTKPDRVMLSSYDDGLFEIQKRILKI